MEHLNKLMRAVRCGMSKFGSSFCSLCIAFNLHSGEVSWIAANCCCCFSTLARCAPSLSRVSLRQFITAEPPLTLDFFSCETDVRNDRDRLLASLRAECLHLPAEPPAE